jgi:hypothetical protein
MQLTHLITHQAITANPMNYTEYVGMDWRIATNYGLEVISHSGTLPGWLLWGLYLVCKLGLSHYVIAIHNKMQI